MRVLCLILALCLTLGAATSDTAVKVKPQPKPKSTTCVNPKNISNKNSSDLLKLMEYSQKATMTSTQIKESLALQKKEDK